MTTPSIRETLLTFHARANLATEHLRREAEQLREEAPCLGPAFAVTRRLVAARLGEIEHEADVLERDLIADAAALLCLRTDDSGGCDIDLPAKRPAGRPTRTEAAARARVGTEPPADPPTPTATTETPTAGADAFMAAVADSRDPGQVRLVLSDLDWAVDEMNQYSDTALAYAAKHGLKPSEVTRTDDGGMQIGVDGDVIP